MYFRSCLKDILASTPILSYIKITLNINVINLYQLPWTIVKHLPLEVSLAFQDFISQCVIIPSSPLFVYWALFFKSERSCGFEVDWTR